MWAFVFVYVHDILYKPTSKKPENWIFPVDPPYSCLLHISEWETVHRLSLFLKGITSNLWWCCWWWWFSVCICSISCLHASKEWKRARNFCWIFKCTTKRIFHIFHRLRQRITFASRREWGVRIVTNYFYCKKPFSLASNRLYKLITITSNNLSSCMFSTCK